MAFTPIIHYGAGFGYGGATDGYKDTTGAKLITVSVAHVDDNPVIISDNKGNTYLPLTRYGTSGYVGQRWYYCINPTVGPGHTWTLQGAFDYFGVDISAWTCAGTPVFDKESGGTVTSASSIQPGSLTPTHGNSLILAALAHQATDTYSVDSAFSVIDAVANADYNNCGNVTAYKLQGATPAAVNPTFTKASGSTRLAAAMAIFYDSADLGGGGGGGDTQAPTGSITSHTAGQVVRGSTTVTATCADNVAVTSTQPQIDGSNSGSATTGSNLTSASKVFDTTLLSNGNHTFGFVLSDGTNTTTISVTLVVDNSAPTGSVATPATDGTQVSGTSVSFAGTCADNRAVVGIQPKIDGTNWGSEITGTNLTSFSKNLDSTALGNGLHTATFVLRDEAGNTTTLTRTFNVNNVSGGGDTQAPVIDNFTATQTNPTLAALAWSARDLGGGSVASFDLDQSTDNGATWTNLFLGQNYTGYNASVVAGQLTKFRLRARDTATPTPNVSGYSQVSITTTSDSPPPPVIPGTPASANFDEILLNKFYSNFAEGGPEWATNIVRSGLGGAVSSRAINREDYISKYEIQYAELASDELADLREFAIRRRGMARGFRFLAPDDKTLAREIVGVYNASTGEVERMTATDGAKTVFYLIKYYADDFTNYTRRIVKPSPVDAFKIEIASQSAPGVIIDSIEAAGVVSPTGVMPDVKTVTLSGIGKTVTIDFYRGKLTFNSAPAANLIIYVTGIYHLPTFFSNDWQKMRVDEAGISDFSIGVEEALPVELGIV